MNKDKTTRELAIEWWSKLSEPNRNKYVQMCLSSIAYYEVSNAGIETMYNIRHKALHWFLDTRIQGTQIDICQKYDTYPRDILDTTVVNIYLSEHPQPEEQVKEVDILKEDYNILNYKYAECIKVNTGLKEVNKLLVDALLDIINEIEPIPINGKDSQTITEYLVLSKAKEALKEANLIK